jgi:pimeloyl-ACP methyl ester carboxylesterase
MTNAKPFVQSTDGTEIHVAEYGEGRPILIVHGGPGEAAHWDPVGQLLSPPYRILGIERRGYGRSGAPQSPHSMAREAEDIAAVLGKIGEPTIVVGHSSGAVATLEGALLHPANLAGVVLYEPPVNSGAPLGGDYQRQAEEALANGEGDRALQIFFRDIVGFPQAMLDDMRSPKWRAGWDYMITILPNQMADNRAIRALPQGVECYRAIDVPALLLRGTESPKHLHERLAALAAVLPHPEIVDLPGEAHNANMSSPQMVADAITTFAKTVFG